MFAIFQLVIVGASEFEGSARTVVTLELRDMVNVGWSLDVAFPDRRESIRSEGCDGFGEFKSDSVIVVPY